MALVWASPAFATSWASERTSDHFCFLRGAAEDNLITLRGQSVADYTITVEPVQSEHFRIAAEIGGRSIYPHVIRSGHGQLTFEMRDSQEAGLDLIGSGPKLRLSDGFLVKGGVKDGRLPGGGGVVSTLDISIDLDGIGPALEEFRGCLRNLISAPRKPVALNYNEWFHSQDLKELQSASNEIGGHYSIAIDVDKNGAVTDCRVLAVEESEQSLLCGLVRSRARFEPAYNKYGEPDAGTFKITLDVK